MRKKSLADAKLVVRVDSDRQAGIIRTVSVFDNRTNRYWSADQIKERGIESFLSIGDLKESLNWKLNGDEKKYQFKWGMSGGGHSEGQAYIYA